MTILFVGNFLAAKSGTQSISYSVATGLEKHGVKVSFASRQANRYLRFISIVWNALFSFYDIMHIDVFSNNSFVFAKVANAIGQGRNKKTILTLHGGSLNEFHRGREEDFDRLFSSATKICTPSSFLKSHFEKFGYKIIYLPNPIRLDRFPNNHSNFVPSSLLWVRAFSKIYNPILAIFVLNEVLNTFPDASLTMVGPDKGLLAEAKELIYKFKLTDKVKITGPIPNSELFQFYQSHHVYINTPSYESFGVAVLEAASCGIPIVSTSVGEIPRLWCNGHDALLVDSMEPQEMARQICKVLSDVNLQKRLSVNARRKAEEFSWNKIKGQWLALLNDLGHTPLSS